MVELNRVDEVQRFRTYKIYGKHHLPHYGEHKLVATIHMNTGDNSLADCENLPVLFMNAQTYRDDAMRLRSEIERLREALRNIGNLSLNGCIKVNTPHGLWVGTPDAYAREALGMPWRTEDPDYSNEMLRG